MEDKVVVVTGAGSGIGRVTALALAREGARLSLSDVDEAGGKETLAAVAAAGAEAMFLRTDVTEGEQVAAMIGRTVERFGMAGLIGVAGLSPYVASKHAVIGLTRTAAAEVSSQGIRVNAVCPGLIRTPMLDRLERTLGPEMFAAYVGMTPIQRVAEPAEVAAVVVWLCSDAASFVTGSAMTVDGGVTAV